MSTSCFDREDETFIVLINKEEQYSIWPHWKKVPGGWTPVDGVKGDKKTVLEWVDKNWTDMRPKSLRDWMDEQEKAKQGADAQAKPETAKLEAPKREQPAESSAG